MSRPESMSESLPSTNDIDDAVERVSQKPEDTPPLYKADWKQRFKKVIIPKDVNTALGLSHDRPTQKSNSHPVWVMEDWRNRIWNNFIELEGAAILREKLIAKGIISIDPLVLSGQFQKDAETVLKIETKDLEAEGPTGLHLHGESLDPSGLFAIVSSSDDLKPKP